MPKSRNPLIPAFSLMMVRRGAILNAVVCVTGADRLVAVPERYQMRSCLYMSLRLRSCSELQAAAEYQMLNCVNRTK